MYNDKFLKLLIILGVLTCVLTFCFHVFFSRNFRQYLMKNLREKHLCKYFFVQ